MMKLFSDKETFKIQTQLESDDILGKLSSFVDFKHKGTISTFQIVEEYYGNIENECFVKIWKKPAVSGFMDKGFAPTINIYFNSGEIEVSVNDNLFILLLVVLGMVIFSAGFPIYIGILHPDLRGMLWFGLLMVSFPLIGFVIERMTFFGTIKDIKKRLKKFDK